MEVFLECCMTLFFSAAMLLLIVRLAKGEEKNMMFARVFSLASNVGFWIGIVAVYTPEFDFLSVEVNHFITDFNGPKSNVIDDGFITAF